MVVQTAQSVTVTQNAVVGYFAQINQDSGTPTIIVNIEGTKRRFILDTGCNVLLFQPGVGAEVLMTTNLSPYRVTVDELEIKGE